ncbi:hypothetical protein L1D27_17740 [Vibrio harveyi]|uniref:hypothetical protein n=1 Tax=Vibrio harveyi TaxID=669 RepID=UPI001EFE00CA|nr:hypothetical protein [Vibrio harveyi]MCG9550243.1 hypothetical protein [Vibrio harveyi]
MQINNTFRLQVEEALCKTQFSLEDFEIKYPSYGVLVSIEFLHHKGFKISLEEIEYEETLQLHRNSTAQLVAAMASTRYGEPETKTVTRTKFVSTESPGEVKATDAVSLTYLTGFLERLAPWTRHIENELSSLYSQPEDVDSDIENQIEAIFPKEIVEPNSKFSDKEVKELKTNLNELYKRVKELQEQCNISQAKLDSLRSAIDKASESAPKYPKAMWLKLNKGKIKETLVKIVKSEEGRQFLLKVVEKIALT